MIITKKRGDIVKEFIIENVGSNSDGIINITAKKFEVSRQAVAKHINQLVSQNILNKVKIERTVKYFLTAKRQWTKTFTISENSSEDVVWRNEIKQQLGQLPINVLTIWQHGFSEMFNNAIDHSEGTHITVQITQDIYSTTMVMADNGVGIFTKIKENFELLDERHSVIELTKGKLTTDPKNHSGEGIFFSSRMFDEYRITSGEVVLSHKYGTDEDWIFQNSNLQKGTVVFMKLKHNTTRTAKEIFDQFSDENYGFTKTIVPVRLAQYGDEQLVSRSQAKRLLARIEKFKIVIFNFGGVESIGQAFSDEIFRVFANQHKTIEMIILNANENVKKMINHVRSQN
ncbi:MAG: DUF4325 domain-containing protein [Desulfamplus sp.]|nr:DUF4325 domain-containing protein [Desulfamplus sp.]